MLVCLNPINVKTAEPIFLWDLISLGMLKFSLFKKTIVSVRKRRLKIENQTVVFQNDRFHKNRRFVNDDPSLTIVN